MSRLIGQRLFLIRGRKKHLHRKTHGNLKITNMKAESDARLRSGSLTRLRLKLETEANQRVRPLLAARPTMATLVSNHLLYC